MTFTTRALLRPLIIGVIALLGAACGSASDDVTAAAEGDAASPSSIVTTTAAVADKAADPESDPDAIVDGEACSAMKDLIDGIAELTKASYSDVDHTRTVMTGVTDALDRVIATAPTDGVADDAQFVAEAWSPWNDALAAVDYDFFAVEPEVFEEFVAAPAGPEEFADRSNRVLQYAVDNCGVSQATVDAATGADAVGAEIDLDTGELDMVDTGVSITLTIEGEEVSMNEGFCGIGADGLLVGSWEGDGTTVSILHDTTGNDTSINTISVQRDGSAGGAQIEVEYGDGQGAFQSSRYVGVFTCS